MKLKKLLIGFGTASALVIPVATVISCGKSVDWSKLSKINIPATVGKSEYVFNINLNKIKAGLEAKTIADPGKEIGKQSQTIYRYQGSSANEWIEFATLFQNQFLTAINQGDMDNAVKALQSITDLTYKRGDAVMKTEVTYNGKTSEVDNHTMKLSDLFHFKDFKKINDKASAMTAISEFIKNSNRFNYNEVFEQQLIGIANSEQYKAFAKSINESDKIGDKSKFTLFSFKISDLEKESQLIRKILEPCLKKSVIDAMLDFKMEFKFNSDSDEIKKQVKTILDELKAAIIMAAQ